MLSPRRSPRRVHRLPRGRVIALIAAAVAATLLAVNPVAAALRSEHTFTLKLSAKTTKKSTGATISTDRNVTSPAAGTKAVLVTKIVFAFPAGTKFNTAAATRCSVAVLQAQGAAGCKSGSAVGGGSAAAITGTPFDPIRQQVAVYATTTGLAAILTGLQTAVLALKVKDNKITAVLPRICRPPGTLANDCANGDIVLKGLDITLKATSKGSGSRTKRLITTPATCVGAKWQSSATYTFSNGDSEVRRSRARCRRA